MKPAVMPALCADGHPLDIAVVRRVYRALRAVSRRITWSLEEAVWSTERPWIETFAIVLSAAYFIVRATVSLAFHT